MEAAGKITPTRMQTWKLRPEYDVMDLLDGASRRIAQINSIANVADEALEHDDSDNAHILRAIFDIGNEVSNRIDELRGCFAVGTHHEPPPEEQA